MECVSVYAWGGWLFLLLLLLLLTNVLLLVSIRDAALHLMVAPSSRCQPWNDNKDSVNSITLHLLERNSLTVHIQSGNAVHVNNAVTRPDPRCQPLRVSRKATVIKTEWHPITGVRAAAARCSTRFKRWSLAAFQTSCLTNDIGQKGKSINTEPLANAASGRPGIRRRRSRGNQNNKGEGRELKAADWWAPEALRTLL